MRLVWGLLAVLGIAAAVVAATYGAMNAGLFGAARPDAATDTASAPPTAVETEPSLNPTVFPPATVSTPDPEPTTEQPTTEQPTTEQPTTEQPATEQPTTEQPTTEQPAAEAPAARPAPAPVQAPAPTPPRTTAAASQRPADTTSTPTPPTPARMAAASAPTPAPSMTTGTGAPSTTPADEAIGQCARPSVPAMPPGNQAPSETELSAFAGAVERYDGLASAYRACLYGQINNPRLSEDQRRAALQASNASAEQVGILWDAYDTATTRFRDHQAELAAAAAASPAT